MTETALDLITKSLKRLGVLSGIETPSADLAVDSLDRLNGLIETWSTESLTLWTQETVTPTSPLAPNQPLYTIGPGGDIDVPARPAWIDSVALVLPGSPAYEKTLLPYSRQEWELVSTKAMGSAQPQRFYYRPTWPLGEFAFSPIYDGGSAVSDVRFYLPIPFTGPATLTTVLSYPPGYSRALRDWLAIELAPEMGRPADPALFQSATDAKAQLQRTNFKPRVLHLPFGLNGCGGVYDWRIDE